MARLLTRPTLAAMSPARPEAAKTASLPRYAPFPQARPQRAKRRGDTYRTSCEPFALAVHLGERKSFPTVLPASDTLLLNVEPMSDARTKPADIFSILLWRFRWN